MQDYGVCYTKKDKVKMLLVVIITIIVTFGSGILYNIYKGKGNFKINNFDKVQVNESIKLEYKEDDDKKNEDGEKLIAYLTFDDGPSSVNTIKILKILKESDIHATFFVTGKSVENNSLIFKDIINEGHTIGNHSYSHNYKEIYRSKDNFKEEIIKTNEIIEKYSDNKIHAKIFRFPGGSTNKSQELKDVLKDLNMKSYDWNALNGDAEGQNVSKEKLIENIKTTIKGKDKIIILMHDTDLKKTTVESLKEIIEYLKGLGYKFKTLD